jgi:hypothetical protein
MPLHVPKHLIRYTYDYNLLNRVRAVQLISRNLQFKMAKISLIEYFRVPPRWLFVKITDEAGNVGWGEASLEGHTNAVEGCLDAYIERYTGMDAE